MRDLLGCTWSLACRWSVDRLFIDGGGATELGTVSGGLVVSFACGSREEE